MIIKKEKYEELKKNEQFWHKNWLAWKEALYEAVQEGQLSRELYSELEDRTLELMRTKFWIEKRIGKD